MEIDDLLHKIKKEQQVFAEKLENELVSAQIQQSKNNKQILELMRIKNRKKEKVEEKQQQQQEEKNWEQVLEKIIKENNIDEEQCSICLNNLVKNKNQQNTIYVLDCSHKYHVHCLNAFERYDIEATKCCPMCRKYNYQKKQLVIS